MFVYLLHFVFLLPLFFYLLSCISRNSQFCYGVYILFLNSGNKVLLFNIQGLYGIYKKDVFHYLKKKKNDLIFTVYKTRILQKRKGISEIDAKENVTLALLSRQMLEKTHFFKKKKKKKKKTRIKDTKPNLELSVIFYC